MLAEGGVGVDASTPVCPQTWLRSARNFAKTRFRRSPSIQFSAKKIFFGDIFWSRQSFYAFLGWFWRIYGKTDLTIDFLAVFRSRCTYYELCTTKNCRKSIRRRSELCDALTRTPPVSDPPNALGLFLQKNMFFQSLPCRLLK